MFSFVYLCSLELLLYLTTCLSREIWQPSHTAKKNTKEPARSVRLQPLLQRQSHFSSGDAPRRTGRASPAPSAGRVEEIPSPSRLFGFWTLRLGLWMFPAVIALLLTAVLRCGPAGGEAVHRRQLNHRPIIGILAQEILPSDPSPHGTSYISASYVKYIESAGARVVPVRINRTEEEYEKLFNSINGLLLPGGDVNIETSQFTRTAKIFFKLAIKANDAGDYFPVWGTCQGLQQLSVLTANKNLLTHTDTEAVALPLTFSSAAQTSRLFRHFPKNLFHALSKENITGNFHYWSLSVQNYSRNADLKRFYKVLSTNTDGKVEFISTMEAYRYPFYAVQWHPEKSPFEWIDKPGMVHSVPAVQTSFYTASFFVSEARKNQHTFSSKQEEEKALIYNYIPYYKSDPFYFVQIYYFD